LVIQLALPFVLVRAPATSSVHCDISDDRQNVRKSRLNFHVFFTFLTFGFVFLLSGSIFVERVVRVDR
jgi:hypothetical protein